MKKIVILTIFILCGLSIAWADDAIKKACPDGVKPNKALQKHTLVKHKKWKDRDNNPYGLVSEETVYKTEIINENGKCYKFSGAKFEFLVDNNHAIYSMFIDESYSSEHRLFLFDFGNSNVTLKRISGIIKTTGEYFDYKDRRNIPRTMPKVIVIK